MLRTRKTILSRHDRKVILENERKLNKNRLFSAFEGANQDPTAVTNPVLQYTNNENEGREVGVLSKHYPADLAALARVNSGDSGAGYDSDFLRDLAPLPAAYFESEDDLLPFNELRRYARLSDKDLRYHAGRIYLGGVNSPLYWMGGSWLWPPICPQSLLYAVYSKQYASFAQRVNDLMAYPANGWEMITYLILLTLLPPFAELFLLRRRLFRAKLLLSIFATVKNPFFQSNKSSLRLSISPDLTVAYVDFLIDIDFYERSVTSSKSVMGKLTPRGLTKGSPATLRRASPNQDISTMLPTPGPLSQPKLPIFIRFCGMGTYICPWYLDSNDILLQAIPLADDVSVFIDVAFINFIYEFNNILKSLRRQYLKDDLLVLLKVTNCTVSKEMF